MTESALVYALMSLLESSVSAQSRHEVSQTALTNDRQWCLRKHLKRDQLFPQKDSTTVHI